MVEQSDGWLGRAAAGRARAQRGAAVRRARQGAWVLAGEGARVCRPPEASRAVRDNARLLGHAPAALSALPLYLNGKFSAQPLTGVQRVARETVRALDDLAPASASLLLPAAGRAPALRHLQASRVGSAGLPLHVWEQVALPWATRDGWLLNLAGAAPALARKQTCVIHDAAVFDHPEAYRPAFVHWYRFLFRWLARRRAVQLVTVSAFSQQRLAAALGVDASRIAVVPNGGDHLDAVLPDAACLQRLGLERGRFLLAVGSANPTKNLPRLVRAYARSGLAPGVKLVLVGGTRRHVFAATDEGEAQGVLHAGVLGDAQLKALYGAALGLVVPSLYEGFGLPPLEAMACGCPVAAAEAASLPEVCGDAALYFDPRSEDAIAGALCRLQADAPLRERLRAAGCERAAAFTWRASAARLLQLVGEASAA
jgi:glycosyltransferase involved in cell wall biosynthesis